MKKALATLTATATAAAVMAAPMFHANTAEASSHMDAPRIVFDDAANTTDVYAFVTMRDGVKYLSTALAVYPHQEPGIGPNKYNFDDEVRYEIHVATGDDVASGEATISYQFDFQTHFKTEGTILQSYLDVIQDVDDSGQNLTQTYTVTKIDRRQERRNREIVLGTGVVPPNNQGIATPSYNQGDDGENPAKDGVASAADLDRYTKQTIAELDQGYRSFAGQRDDGFYADIQSIFDLLRLRDAADGANPAEDSQGGFNVHTMVLEIPISDLGSDQQIVGVYATTSRRQYTKLDSNPEREPQVRGRFIQVGRQGNPLFCEALVAIADKDLYNRSSPKIDSTIFRTYAENPELAKLANLILGTTAPETNRTDLAGIYIPDVIKVDLSTGPVPLAGGGSDHMTNPDDTGFHRLSIFGGDTVFSPLQNTMVPGGWPNGRRFGDDVVDIAFSAVLSDLRVNPPTIVVAGDNVDSNDIAYNKVFLTQPRH
jgi:hypothetical protein